MNVLLLQGPQGFFLSCLYRELVSKGHNCYRVVFNGGDLFNAIRDPFICFRGYPNEWKGWLADYCIAKQITHIFVYGDCRFYHEQARSYARESGIEFLAFEEGYIRPNYVTLESQGVNAHSTVNLADIEHWRIKTWRQVTPIRWGYYALCFHATFYYIAMTLLRPFFSHYLHHRNSSSIKDALWHCRGAYRRYLYRFTQYRYWKVFRSTPFFLVPLQVSYDSQVSHHSDFKNMDEFIEYVADNFQQYAPRSALLVFKHHPIDRGQNNYAKVIKRVAQKYGLEKRVYYIHDFNLPKLVKLAQGIVTINSTTAISAYHHGTPVKILGRSFYNVPNLAYQKSLKDFWQMPEPAEKLFYLKFRNYLEYRNQFNGNFYSRPRMTAKAIVEKYS